MCFVMGRLLVFEMKSRLVYFKGRVILKLHVICNSDVYLSKGGVVKNLDVSCTCKCVYLYGRVHK